MLNYNIIFFLITNKIANYFFKNWSTILTIIVSSISKTEFYYGLEKKPINWIHFTDLKHNHL